MSFNSDSSPPSTARDWIFPSPSFTHSSYRDLRSAPRRRRFSTYPRAPKTTHSQFQSQNLSKYSNTSGSISKYTGLRRRRFEFRYDGRDDKSPAPPDDASVGKADDAAASQSLGNCEVQDDKTKSFLKTFTGFANGRLRVRWQLAFIVAILITVFSSLVHKNFSLHSEVIELQDKISKLSARLKLCDLFDSVDISDSSSLDADKTANKNLKIAALVISITLLSLPFLFFKYVDYISNSRRSLDNNAEEVSLKKQLAYRVDLFISVNPYAKPLALLVATILVIGLGGLALYGVTDDGLVDCLWLSWTYVASSGNHADSEGIGPRLVSVSISFGGMLIFAMMLGLVSDAISEKFDSLRKGRSEVVEQNHTLILGWSDKLSLFRDHF